MKLLLDALKLECFAKTSGKRGLHVLVPIAPGPTHDQATGFAEQVARAVAKVLPKVATVERMKDKRGGKLYVDYGQNGEGRTVVSPYTIRARDGAVVSTPVTWDEVTEELDPTCGSTIRTSPSAGCRKLPGISRRACSRSSSGCRSADGRRRTVRGSPLHRLASTTCRPWSTTHRPG